MTPFLLDVDFDEGLLYLPVNTDPQFWKEIEEGPLFVSQVYTDSRISVIPVELNPLFTRAYALGVIEKMVSDLVERSGTQLTADMFEARSDSDTKPRRGWLRRRQS